MMWSWEWYNMDLDSTIHLTTTSMKFWRKTKKIGPRIGQIVYPRTNGRQYQNILRNVSDTLIGILWFATSARRAKTYEVYDVFPFYF